MRKTLAVLVVFVLLAMVPAQALAADWVTYGYDAQHTSHTDDLLASPLEAAWVSNSGGKVVGSPLIAGNTVYYSNGEGRSFIAADLATGKARWIFTAISSIESTPALVNDTVIFGSYDSYKGSNDSHIYRLRASDGTLMWKTQLGSGIFSSPLIYDDRIYVGTDENDFYALDLATGNVVWKLTYNTTQGSPAGDRGKVFIGMQNGKVYALDAATGNVAWAFDTDSSIHASPAIFDGKVFIATRGGTLYAFDEDTGTVVWKANLGYKADATPSIYPESGLVLTGTYGGYVKAFHANNGTPAWTSPFLGPIYSTTTVSGNTVYGVTQDGWMFALDKSDGTIMWGMDIGGITFASPAVANGYLVVGTWSNQLLAFKASAKVVTPAPEPATSSTPAASGGSQMQVATSAATPAQSPFPGVLAVIGSLGIAYALYRRR